MSRALLVLLGAAFTAGAAWAMGGILLHRLRVKLNQNEQHLFSLMCGFALLSTVVFAISALRLAYPVTFAEVGLAALGWRIWKVPRIACSKIDRSDWWFWAFYGVFGALYVIYAMAPEISPDGATYHLGLVAQYAREHALLAIPDNMYANLSQGVEMLFLFAFAFGKHSAAALTHCVFLLALPLLMAAYGRRAGFPRAGLAAGLFVFLSPVAGVTGTSAYNDIAAAALIFTCFYLVEIWTESRERGLLMIAGLIAGFCYATKYTAFLAVPYVLIRVTWQLRRDGKELARAAVILCVCAAAMILPWMIKNTVVAQNPFAPFLNSAFPNQWVNPSFEKNYVNSLRIYEGLKSYADVPIEATVRGRVLAGFLGPLFLLTPVGLIALRWAAGRRILLAALVFALTYAGNCGTRFLLPALPFVALSMALAMQRVPGLLPALVLAHAVLAWPSVMPKYCERYAWKLESKIPLRAALRKEREEDYLKRRMEYRVARMVERAVPPGVKAFAFSPIAEAYTTREIVTGSYSTPGNMLREALWIPSVAWMQPVNAARFPFSRRRVQRLRLTQLASDNSDQWSITELYFFNGDSELRRSRNWRITANPNPWEAPLAFDNSGVTRWNSRHTLEPGMTFEVDFGEPQELDSVLLRAVPDQVQARMKLEGASADGKWELLNSRPEQFELGPPLELRRMAIEELRARGIGYLIVADYDVGLTDFLERADLWGIRLAGEETGTRLFEIKTPQQ